MSQHLSPDLLRLPQIAVEAFEGAQDAIALRILPEAWRGEIIAIDLIDTGTYLSAIRVGDVMESGGVRTVPVIAPEADSYAAAIKRKADSDYAGQRVAEEAIEASDNSIIDELDRAGNSLK